MVIEKSIVGDLINFRGLVYSPINENGVIFLFGQVMQDLNMYVEEIKPGFPDCVGRRFVGKGWERIRIEFEYQSHNFVAHEHDPKDCDMIICWEHDWPGCPIEVIELRDIIRSLPNELIPKPNPKVEYAIEEYVGRFPKHVQELFRHLDGRLRELSDGVWSKATKSYVGYYSPERAFIYLHCQKKGLLLHLFTRGQKLEQVAPIGHKSGGAKWGKVTVQSVADIDIVMPSVRQSHERIGEALKNNESTCWNSDFDDQSTEAANGFSSASTAEQPGDFAKC